MTDFQLYKKRDFSAFMNDTIQFFKQYGKNFFLNYLVINGGILLLFSAIYYIYFKNNFANSFAKNPANPLEMFGSNIGLFFGFVLIFLIVSMIYYLFTLAYPMVYIKLIGESTGKELQSGQLFNNIKSKLGKIFLFGLISMFILLPLGMLFFGISIALSFLLIGIPLLLVGLPAFLVWYQQSLYVYINEEIGYFEALRRGWKTIFSNFSHVIGSSIIVLICVSILGSSLSMIPGFMMMGSVMTSGGKPEAMVMTPLMVILYILGIIVSSLMMNVFYIHQGLIYYSTREITEENQAFSEIDNIGKNEE